MKHLVRASATALILALTAFGLTACGSSDDDCDDNTSGASAQLAIAPDLLSGTGGRGSSGSKPKPQKLTKPQTSKPRGGKPGSKPQSSKHKGSKPKGGSHHDDICDED
ncbi:hypothetical protein [Streptomyces sp. H27-C3]|uniref:hypothetical protein n=1 Tax=Streptomyces sp. H27-C3 TaxID=3046305 RepID=UPI0024BBD904|nr:hypothetical protein [Streptomyces sp. H27-C3]MDJ0467037.1 hypothetical protein [Streptomyces sp. H27-C3]